MIIKKKRRTRKFQENFAMIFIGHKNIQKLKNQKVKVKVKVKFVRWILQGLIPQNHKNNNKHPREVSRNNFFFFFGFVSISILQLLHFLIIHSCVYVMWAVGIEIYSGNESI